MTVAVSSPRSCAKVRACRFRRAEQQAHADDQNRRQQQHITVSRPESAIITASIVMIETKFWKNAASTATTTSLT